MHHTIFRITSAGMLVLALGACGRSAPQEGADLLGQSSAPTTSLVIATTQPPTTQPVATTQPSYVIQDGDSLSQIAQRFGVSMKALADFNGIEDADAIKVGQTLTIPPTTVAASG